MLTLKKELHRCGMSQSKIELQTYNIENCPDNDLFLKNYPPEDEKYKKYFADYVETFNKEEKQVTKSAYKAFSNLSKQIAAKDREYVDKCFRLKYGQTFDINRIIVIFSLRATIGQESECLEVINYFFHGN